MSAARRDAFSRPVFDQTIRIQSNHAQRLLDRGFLLVVRALYGIDVVLRIIGDDEEMDQVEEIVSKLITELAEELRAELPLLFDFLGVPDPERPAPALEAEARQRRLLALLKRYSVARSQREPAVIVFEDLHWIDTETQAFLDLLSESVASQ